VNKQAHSIELKYENSSCWSKNATLGYHLWHKNNRIQMTTGALTSSVALCASSAEILFAETGIMHQDKNRLILLENEKQQSNRNQED
jgi:hypothetical protein